MSSTICKINPKSSYSELKKTLTTLNTSADLIRNKCTSDNARIHYLNKFITTYSYIKKINFFNIDLKQKHDEIVKIINEQESYREKLTQKANEDISEQTEITREEADFNSMTLDSPTNCQTFHEHIEQNSAIENRANRLANLKLILS